MSIDDDLDWWGPDDAWGPDLDEDERAELEYHEAVAEEDPDYWDDDPFDDHDHDPYPEPDHGCWWCEDQGCRRCVPSRWTRIRWALRDRLNRFLRPRRQAGTAWHDEPPF